MALASSLASLRKFRARQQHMGTWRTIAYVCGVYLLPRLGVHFRHLLMHDGVAAAPAAAGREYRLLSRPEDFTPTTLAMIASVADDQSAEFCHASLAQGRSCVLALERGGGTATALLWLQPAPAHLQPGDVQRLLVRDVVTAFAARGRGIATQLVCFAVAEAVQRAAPRPVDFVANVMLGNVSSVRMLTKSGFRRAGFSLSLGRWGCVRRRERDGTRLRFFRNPA